MDSRQIYQASQHLYRLVTWESDWIYFGTDIEINLVQIYKFIDEHLDSDEILFVYERSNSGEYQKYEIIEIIKPLLGVERFKLWNISMNRIIEFASIGVLHRGVKKESE